MARIYKKKELGQSWVKEAKTLSLHEGRQAFDESLDAFIGLPQNNELLYRRFCSFAHDDVFRAGVYQNAQVHRAWGIYDSID